MENLPECQFQVLACQPALCQEYSDSHRPMIKKIVRLENHEPPAWCFRSHARTKTFCSLASAPSCEPRQFFASYITVLVRTEDQEPRIVETGAGDDKVIMLQYEKVFALEAQSPKPFRMEAFCQLAQAIHFNMCDNNVHMVIGKVTAEDDGTDMVLVAEKVFKLHSDAQVQAVKAERANIADVQMISSKKRHAAALVLQGEKRQVVVSCRMIACGDAPWDCPCVAQHDFSFFVH